MVSINKLTVDFGGFLLFNDVSFQINHRDRIGLVGKNGAGKTTLLKIISGLMEPTTGSVSMPKGYTIGYLPQHMNHTNTHSVIEEVETAFEELKQIEKDIEKLNMQIAEREDYDSPVYMKLLDRMNELNDRFNLLGGTNYTALIETTLKGLGFRQSDFNRNTGEFSGGWRMRIELAKLLLKKPDLFLLDEPTNHLDIDSIQWLEDFLKDYNGTVVIISHDRAFLNNLTNRTIEISLGKIYDYKVPYDKFIELRKERREQQLAAYRNQQKKIEDTEKFIERFRYKATKAVQVQSRIKQLEKIDRIEIDEFDTRKLNIKFPPAPRSGTVVVEGRNVSKSYGSLEVLKNIDITLERGEKVAFVGRNGEGKTTLARVILGELEYSGTVKIGHNVKIGYFAQNQAELLDDNLTVLETIDNVAVGDIRTKIRDLLGAFLFSGEDVEKKVAVLSGGERTRLAMVKLLLEPVNFLVLDEPTNHLDIHSKEILKQAIIDFEGTVLVVSHDREFLDGLVTKLYEFKDKKIKEHLMGVYEFLQKKKMESLNELAVKRTANNSSTQKKEKKQGAVSYEERKAINREYKKAKQELEKNEAEIAEKEQQLDDMKQKMSDPAHSSDNTLFTEYGKLEKRLDELMYEWELLNEKLEEAEKKKAEM
ncbi:MAG: ATP-binding cassette domain-containing protein [Chlorobi bacterium]|nr:ATP-binding cassette domain-containing protein [Chlorobiota bacterium]